MFIYNIITSNVKFDCTETFRVYDVIEKHLYDCMLVDGKYSDAIVKYENGTLTTLDVRPLIVMYSGLRSPEGHSVKKTQTNSRMHAMVFGNVKVRFMALKNNHRIATFKIRSMSITNINSTQIIPISMPLTRIDSTINMYASSSFFICWGVTMSTIVHTETECGEINCYIIIKYADSPRNEDSESEGDEVAETKYYQYSDLVAMNPFSHPTPSNFLDSAYFQCADYVSLYDVKKSLDEMPIRSFNNYGSFVTLDYAKNKNLNYATLTEDPNVVFTAPLGVMSTEMPIIHKSSYTNKNIVHHKKPVVVGFNKTVWVQCPNIDCILDCQEPSYVKFICDRRGYGITLYKNVKCSVNVVNTDVTVYKIQYLTENSSRSISKSLTRSVDIGSIDAISLEGKIGKFISTASTIVQLVDQFVVVVTNLSTVVLDLVNEVDGLVKSVKVNPTSVVQKFSVDYLMNLPSVPETPQDTEVSRKAKTSLDPASVDMVVDTVVTAVTDVVSGIGESVQGIETAFNKFETVADRIEEASQDIKNSTESILVKVDAFAENSMSKIENYVNGIDDSMRTKRMLAEKRNFVEPTQTSHKSQFDGNREVPVINNVDSHWSASLASALSIENSRKFQTKQDSKVSQKEVCREIPQVTQTSQKENSEAAKEIAREIAREMYKESKRDDPDVLTERFNNLSESLMERFAKVSDDLIEKVAKREISVKSRDVVQAQQQLDDTIYLPVDIQNLDILTNGKVQSAVVLNGVAIKCFRDLGVFIDLDNNKNIVTKYSPNENV